MEEKQLAENIMKTIGSSLVNEDDLTVSGSKIAERYMEMIVKAGYDIFKYENCRLAILHYVICAGYREGKFEYRISNHIL